MTHFERFVATGNFFVWQNKPLELQIAADCIAKIREFAEVDHPHTPGLLMDWAEEAHALAKRIEEASS